MNSRKNQPSSAFHSSAEPIAFGAVRLEQDRAQGGRERQRDEGREHRRDGDRQGELPEELAGDAGEKRGRYEHGGETEGDGDHGAGHFVHGFVGGGARRQALGDVSLDVFHDDDRVVDDDADRQHQAEQREHIEREAERRPSRRTCR